MAKPQTPEPRLGDVYLNREELRSRVAELGREISRDYAGREPLLVAPLKASLVFVVDLSRVLTIHHALDFIELASYAAGADTGGHARIRLLKDLDGEIAGRDVLIVEDVIDTGLTLNYLCKTLALRDPASLAAVTLLDRPYRRLVEDVPVRYVGFTVPDELFVGYGFDLQERYRNLLVGETLVSPHQECRPVYLREFLQSAQHPVACDLSGAQFVQQLDGFRRGHRLRMPKPLAVWHLKTHWAS